MTRDRPGYAKSTRRRGRSVVDDVDDVVLVADHLGVGRFGVSGGSGGGPHAPACAAQLPDRVVGAAVAVSPAPVGRGGMEYEAWIEGMDPENVAFSKLEIAGDEPALTQKLEDLRVHIARDVADNPRAGTESSRSATPTRHPHSIWRSPESWSSRVSSGRKVRSAAGSTTLSLWHGHGAWSSERSMSLSC